MPEGRGRDIARRIQESSAALDGVDAVFVEVTGELVSVYFILGVDDIDQFDALFELEEQLIADFGREHLAVHSFTPDLMSALPSLSGAYTIIDRRR
ncbi:hypothetical protein [Enhygromyxa salina]|uniref:hypothetical protein n=1 Tax=Enhygromyxa salina TaxID=215803 RepID=UPI000D08959F|nr:hypothetical protein [Enhygromyxa salina]